MPVVSRVHVMMSFVQQAGNAELEWAISLMMHELDKRKVATERSMDCNEAAFRTMRERLETHAITNPRPVH